MFPITVTVTGPITVHAGPTADQIRTIVAAEMATALAPLEATIMSDFTDLRDMVSGVFADLAAKIDRLQDAVDNADSSSHLAPEDQAAFDEIKALVQAARGTVGDENADGVPAVETPVDPAEDPSQNQPL